MSVGKQGRYLETGLPKCFKLIKKINYLKNKIKSNKLKI
jgi:hypothetical protein